MRTKTTTTKEKDEKFGGKKIERHHVNFVQTFFFLSPFNGLLQPFDWVCLLCALFAMGKKKLLYVYLASSNFNKFRFSNFTFNDIAFKY